MADNSEDTMKMPKSVAEAVLKVMGGIKKLGKENRNKFDGYDFTSIDDFMEMTGPLCAEAGLIIVQDEVPKPELIEKPGKNGNVLMLWCEFDYTLHSSMGESYGPLRRSVMVQATGAQAFGSAQSYSQKQFERSLFKIPTGDKDDPDNDATKEIGTPPAIDLKKMAASIKRAINAAGNPNALQQVSITYADDLTLIEGVSKTAHEHLMNEIDKKSKLLVNQMGEK